MNKEQQAIEQIELSINLDMPAEQNAMINFYGKKKDYLNTAIKLLSDEITEIDNTIQSFENMSGGKRKERKQRRRYTKKTKKC
jgi:hypothetical protein